MNHDHSKDGFPLLYVIFSMLRHRISANIKQRALQLFQDGGWKLKEITTMMLGEWFPLYSDILIGGGKNGVSFKGLNRQ
jgi:hypothetical protein